MTTAHRPTWAPAKGGEEQGGNRMYVPSRMTSAKDQPGQLTLKFRQEGQASAADILKRDLRVSPLSLRHTLHSPLCPRCQRLGRFHAACVRHSSHQPWDTIAMNIILVSVNHLHCLPLARQHQKATLHVGLASLCGLADGCHKSTCRLPTYLVVPRSRMKVWLMAWLACHCRWSLKRKRASTTGKPREGTLKVRPPSLHQHETAIQHSAHE